MTKRKTKKVPRSKETLPIPKEFSVMCEEIIVQGGEVFVKQEPRIMCEEIIVRGEEFIVQR